jgi:hypothetical protein
MQDLLKDRKEVEIIDLMIRVKEQLVRSICTSL